MKTKARCRDLKTSKDQDKIYRKMPKNTNMSIKKNTQKPSAIQKINNQDDPMTN